jgi:hypothetical protein
MHSLELDHDGSLVAQHMDRHDLQAARVYHSLHHNANYSVDIVHRYVVVPYYMHSRRDVLDDTGCQFSCNSCFRNVRNHAEQRKNSRLQLYSTPEDHLICRLVSCIHIRFYITGYHCGSFWYIVDWVLNGTLE